MRNVEEINKGLNVSSLQKMRTDTLASVIFMLLSSGNVGNWYIFAQLIALASWKSLVLLCNFIE
jgi:hypothetical protein